MSEKKQSTPVFNKDTDDRINGFALGISFSFVSAFLLINNTYFHIPWVAYMVGAAFAAFGLIGIGSELDKSQKIKGIGFMVFGIIFLGIWIAIYLFFKNNWLANLLSFVLLVLGCYAFVLGLIQFFWSVVLAVRKGNSLTGKLKPVFVFITQIFGLVLTILNILKIFKIL